MEITKEFLKGLGFEWRNMASFYSVAINSELFLLIHLFSKMVYSEQNTRDRKAVYLGKYDTQESLSALIDALKLAK